MTNDEMIALAEQMAARGITFDNSILVEAVYGDDRKSSTLVKFTDFIESMEDLPRTCFKCGEKAKPKDQWRIDLLGPTEGHIRCFDE